MVSICIATYNGEKFITDQLLSILPQLHSGDEIIISDDGSTDGTIALIQALLDPRIKISGNSCSPGPVGNFESAMRRASGDILFFCDQDDIWFPNKIERHLKYHEKYDLVVSDASVVDEDKNVLFSSFFKQRGSKKGLIQNLKRNSYIGCCMSFNKKISKASTPFPRDIHMHDWWIGLVSEMKGTVYFLNEPLMYYVRHSNNASGTLIKTLPLIEQIRNRIILCKHLVFLKFIKNEH